MAIIDQAALEDKLHRMTSEYIQGQTTQQVDPLYFTQNRERLTGLVWRFLEREGEILPRKTSQEIVEAVVNRMVGLGPIEPFLNDPTITEIMVNSPGEIFIERAGELEAVQASFRDQEHILNVVDRIVAPLGRRVDESTPFVDARLPDGSRVNAIIPPLALRSPALTIRRFSAEPFTLQRLVSLATLNAQMAMFLQACVRSRLNILISGGTGSGKTSTLNALARCIPIKERLVTIEDTAELQLKAANLVSLESRPPNIEGSGEVNIRTLVRNALRMRPDRIIVGEVRGPEAFDMLQAMNTGHPGSLTTVHANSSQDAVRRLESMVLMAGLDLPQPAIRDAISSSLDIVIQQERLPGGSRKIVAISEILSNQKGGWDNFQIQAKEIFSFNREGLDGEGRVKGNFLASEYQPACLEVIRKSGYSVSDQVED
ncbi:MAG TPA: CpaF family protein [Chloroflexi bacterium]|nr:MAG: CpaF family protein [Chloroflexota bacterium]HDD56331.1 CpaF family protein [Chloroflexota bacterium]